MSDSLLASTNPDAISELFKADPLTLDETALTKLVSELRRRRNDFLSAEAAAAAKPKATRAKASAADKAALADSAKAAELDKPTHELTLDDMLGGEDQ